LFVIYVALKGATTFVLFEQQLFLHDKMIDLFDVSLFFFFCGRICPAGLWRGEG
jgi:hypothetical protein